MEKLYQISRYSLNSLVIYQLNIYYILFEILANLLIEEV